MRPLKFMHIPALLLLLLLAALAPSAMAQNAAPAAEAATEAAEEEHPAVLSPAQEELIDLKDKVGRCSAILGRIDRLICYDELAKTLGFIAPEQAGREEEILEKYGFWEVAKRRSASGEEIIYLKNEAVEDIISKAGLKRKPNLVIKCKFGQTDVYMDWKAKLAPYYAYRGIPKLEMVYQLDAGDRIYDKWEISTDANAIFAPNPVEFVKNLKGTDKLIFEITPPGDLMQTVVFDTSGLNVVLDILIKQCYN